MTYPIAVHSGELPPFPHLLQNRLGSTRLTVKLPGTQSLLKKGRAFFNSRKVVTMKVWEEEEKDVLWVRAFVEENTTDRPY